MANEDLRIPSPGECCTNELLKTTLDLPGVENCYIIDSEPIVVASYYRYEKDEAVFGFREEDKLLVIFKDSKTASKCTGVDEDLLDEHLTNEQEEYYYWNGWGFQANATRDDY